MKTALAASLRHPSGRIAVALTAVLLLFVPWAVWGAGLPHRTATANIVWVAYDLLTVIAIWIASCHPRMPRRIALAWKAVALAQLAYAGGDALWGYYESILGIDPWPSFADALYLLFYPLTLAGVLMFPHAPQGRTDRTKFGLDAATVLIGGWMVVWYFVLGPAVLAAGDFATSAWSAAYPVGDLVLLFGAAVLLLRGARGTTARSLSLLAAGILAFLAADIVFGYLSILERYASGTWPDGLFLLAHLIMAWAAALDAGARIGSTAEDHDVEAVERSSTTFLPLTAVALGYAVLFLSGRRPDAAALTTGGPLLYGAILVTVLVAIREAVTARQNRDLAAQLQTMARTDALTGLLSRGEFMAQAEREFSRFRRYHHPIAIVMLDLDDFKAINDRHGHLAGDRALAHIGRVLSEELRTTDLIGRYGGDEFVVLLTDTDARGALATAARIVERVGEQPFRWEGEDLRLRISAGAAEAQDAFPGLRATIEEADRRMYAARGLLQAV